MKSNDLRTLCYKEWVNGDIINNFLTTIAKTLKDAKIKVFDSYFYSCLEQEQPSIELQNIDGNELMQYNMLLLPIHHRSITGNRHWSIVGVCMRKKVVCHCDSLGKLYTEVHSIVFSFLKEVCQCSVIEINMSEWRFVSPKDIVPQNNCYDCGIHTCVNGYGMMRKAIINFEGESDCNEIRYWISSIVRNEQRHKKNKKRNNKNQKSVIIDPDLVTPQMVSESITIFNEVSCNDQVDITDEDLVKVMDCEVEETSKRTIRKPTKCYRASCAADEIQIKYIGKYHYVSNFSL